MLFKLNAIKTDRKQRQYIAPRMRNFHTCALADAGEEKNGDAN